VWTAAIQQNFCVFVIVVVLHLCELLNTEHTEAEVNDALPFRTVSVMNANQRCCGVFFVICNYLDSFTYEDVPVFKSTTKNWHLVCIYYENTYTHHV